MSQSELTKRLQWSLLVAGLGVFASLVSTRIAAVIWRRIYDEEPPE